LHESNQEQPASFKSLLKIWYQAQNSLTPWICRDCV